MGRLVGSITLTALNSGTYISGELFSTLPPVFYATKNLWSTSENNIIYPRLYGRGGDAFVGDKITLVYWKIDGKNVDTETIYGVEKTTHTVNNGAVPALKLNRGNVFGAKDQVVIEGRFIIKNGTEDIQITRTLSVFKSNVINEEYFTQIEVINNDSRIDSKLDTVTLKVHCYKNGEELTIDNTTYKAKWFISSLDDLKGTADNLAGDTNEDGIPDNNRDGVKDGWASLDMVNDRARIDNDTTSNYYTEITVDEKLVSGSATFKVIIYDANDSKLDDADTVIYDISDDVLNLDANTTQVDEGKPALIIAYCTNRYSVPNPIKAVKFKVKEWDITAYKTTFNNGYTTNTTTTNEGISIKDRKEGSTVVNEENMVKYKHTAGTETCTFEVSHEVFGRGTNRCDTVVIQVDAHLL